MSVTSVLRRKEAPGQGARSHTTYPDKLRLGPDVCVESEAGSGDDGGQLPGSANAPAGPERHVHRGLLRTLGCVCYPRQGTEPEKVLSSSIPQEQRRPL